MILGRKVDTEAQVATEIKLGRAFPLVGCIAQPNLVLYQLQALTSLKNSKLGGNWV
eukprot:CAMPEP_0114545920 /NCGR_PEP_ID=MMETSP0114-20121206/3665_1 /TAXON_ID=31324 /ORGANISM="Goniomonas sp, Strain m" /LENGTH=55 /DNA_ID=CAMNT_0001730395 /DNA_START=283 /DNA_END=450 /DNA_ORIENTATION=+